MSKEKKLIGTVKRFGSRYGRTLRHKVGEIEHQQKASYQCPKCRNKKVRRLASGIWQCEKCNAKYTARAYSANMTKQAELEE